MFDPQRIYSRRTYDSKKGQVIQKKGSKANEEIDLNSIPRIIEFLRNNGYYIYQHEPRCPIYIDRYVDVELNSTNTYTYTNSPIDDVDDESMYFNTDILLRSSLEDIHGKYLALMQQVDDLLNPQLTFMVRSVAFSLINSQSGGSNYISMPVTMRFNGMNTTLNFTDVITPLGQQKPTAYGTITRYSGNTFQFLDTEGNKLQFGSTQQSSLAMYSTDRQDIVYNYIDQKQPPSWQFGDIIYDIINVDRQVTFRIFIYIDVAVSFRCKIEPKTEE